MRKNLLAFGVLALALTLGVFLLVLVSFASANPSNVAPQWADVTGAGISMPACSASAPVSTCVGPTPVLRVTTSACADHGGLPVTVRWNVSGVRADTSQGHVDVNSVPCAASVEWSAAVPRVVIGSGNPNPQPPLSNHMYYWFTAVPSVLGSGDSLGGTITTPNCTPIPPPGGDIRVNGLKNVTIASGDTVNVSWTSTDATSCTVTYSDIPGSLTGTSSAGVAQTLFANRIYSLSCTGPGSLPGFSGPISTASVTVTAGPPPPTHLDCLANACVSVAGVGSDACTSNADCAGGSPLSVACSASQSDVTEQGETTVLTATPSGGNCGSYSYSWANTPSSPNQNVNNAKYTTLAGFPPGIYNPSVTVTCGPEVKTKTCGPVHVWDSTLKVIPAGSSIVVGGNKQMTAQYYKYGESGPAPAVDVTDVSSWDVDPAASAIASVDDVNNPPTTQKGLVHGLSAGVAQVNAHYPNGLDYVINGSENVTVSNGAPGPALSVFPTTRNFTAQVGGSNPASQTISVQNAGGGTLNWTASEATPWLSIAPGNGTNNGTITVNVTTGALAVNTYNGTITVADPLAASSPQTVTVTFVVTAGGPPPQVCNNGVQEGSEQCDNGASNGVCPAVCSSTSCTLNSCSPPSAPTGDLKVNKGSGPVDGPITITSGGAVTVSWTSSDATTCKATYSDAGGSITGAPDNSGTTQNLTVTRTYTLNCTGPGGTKDVDTATVNVAQPPVLNATPTVISRGQTSKLVWTAPGATSCTITAPGFSQHVCNDAISCGNGGMVTTNPLDVSTNFIITCDTGSDNAFVTVGIIEESQ